MIQKITISDSAICAFSTYFQTQGKKFLSPSYTSEQLPFNL